MALAPWSVRTADVSGPEQMNIYDYVSDVPLGNASPSVVRAMIENTPGNTPLNRAKGPIIEMQGKYPGPNWRTILFQNAR